MEEQNGSQALAAFEETIKRTNYSYCTQDCGNIDSWTEDERKNNMTEPIPLIVPDIPLSQSDVSFGRSFDGGLTLRFTVTFQLDVGVLAYSNQGMRIIAPNKQNVTDSYVQIRDDIFTERVEDETSNETTPSSPPTTNTTTPIGEQ